MLSEKELLKVGKKIRNRKKIQFCQPLLIISKSNNELENSKKVIF